MADSKHYAELAVVVHRAPAAVLPDVVTHFAPLAVPDAAVHRELVAAVASTVAQYELAAVSAAALPAVASLASRAASYYRLCRTVWVIHYFSFVSCSLLSELSEIYTASSNSRISPG